MSFHFSESEKGLEVDCWPSAGRFCHTLTFQKVN